VSRLVRVALLALFALPIDANAVQPVVIQEGGPGRLRVVVSVDATTSHRSIQLTAQGTPTYPTVDVTCDGKRQAIAQTRAAVTGKAVLAIYEVPDNTARLMLGAAECRLLLPDQEISLPARQLRAAWTGAPKGAEAVKVTSSPTAAPPKPAPAAAAPATSSPPPTPPAPAAPPAASARAGVHPKDAWRCPQSQPIKGNFTASSDDECIYHVPGGQLYEKTKPEMCYATEADARQDGCRRSKR